MTDTRKTNPPAKNPTESASTRAKGRPMLSWVGKKPLSRVTAFPAQAVERFSGAEVDLLLAWPSGELWAIEVKRSLSPKVERGFHAACDDLKPLRKLVVCTAPAAARKKPPTIPRSIICSIAWETA